MLPLHPIRFGAIYKVQYSDGTIPDATRLHENGETNRFRSRLSLEENRRNRGKFTPIQASFINYQQQPSGERYLLGFTQQDLLVFTEKYQALQKQFIDNKQLTITEAGLLQFSSDRTEKNYYKELKRITREHLAGSDSPNPDQDAQNKLRTIKTIKIKALNVTG